jgi:HSP20 family protein
MAQKKLSPSAIRHWKPVKVVEDAERKFLEDVDRIVLENLPSLRFGWRWAPGGEKIWVPMIETYETNDKFVVRVELPGVNSDDIDISASGDSLIVKGERKPSEGITGDQYHECELCYGNFYRRIALPTDVEVGKIEAAYENGILEVHLPKSKAARPTKIPIKNK